MIFCFKIQLCKLTYKMEDEGYVYIMSNNRYNGLLKIGRSINEPIIRVKQLSSQTGAIGKFKVEWSKMVNDSKLYEKILHYFFKKYQDEGEYFKISLVKAKKLAEFVSNSLLGLEEIISSSKDFHFVNLKDVYLLKSELNKLNSELEICTNDTDHFLLETQKEVILAGLFGISKSKD